MDLSKINLEKLAFLISETLKKHGIRAILVGEACVDFLSDDQYKASGLDFVAHATEKQIEKTLHSLGFKKGEKGFFHDTSPFIVDFVKPPKFDLIVHFEKVEKPYGTLELLTPTDCVKDRLTAYFLWNDDLALEQALIVAKRHRIDINGLHEWAKIEGYYNKFSQFVEQLLRED